MKIGILNRATKASSDTKLGEVEQAINLAVDECQMAYMDNFGTNPGASDLAKYVSKEAIAEAISNQGFTLYEGSAANSVKAVSTTISGSGTAFSDAGDTFWVSANGKDGYKVIFKAPEKEGDKAKSGWAIRVTLLTGDNRKFETITVVTGS